MDWAELSRWLPRIEKRIGLSYRQTLRETPPMFHHDLETLREFTLRGGKRLRALLVLAGFHIASGRSPTPALGAAVALEHFQSWMLIHDDIIDHSEQRRGGVTVHRALAGAHRSEGLLGDAGEYGVGMGITLGDLQEPYTVAALRSVPLAAERRLRALDEYVRMTRMTAFGQLLDIRNGLTPVEQVSEEKVLLVHRLKSAYYTVSGPLRIGAILGGGGPALLKELEEIGLDLGIAFQLRDDVIGCGLNGKPGEKSANDLTEGKRTLLVVRARERGLPKSRAALEVALGNPKATDEEVRAAQRAIIDSGSLQYSEQRIRALEARASLRINKSRRLGPTGKQLLREIAEKLLWRDR
ncbi:MAG TPA: polyprenyl synthetase family protein [Thermoplasmata archaeon]|nr:polyprenyl synthetase family protein [Thermoplasmata archaeon]